MLSILIMRSYGVNIEMNKKNSSYLWDYEKEAYN